MSNLHFIKWGEFLKTTTGDSVADSGAALGIQAATCAVALVVSKGLQWSTLHLKWGQFLLFVFVQVGDLITDSGRWCG